MDTVFVSASFSQRDRMRPVTDAIAAVVRQFGYHAIVFVNEYTFAQEDESKMMSTALDLIRDSILLIAEVSHKAVGVGIEVGHAVALDKPVIYLRHNDSAHSTTVGGVAAVSVVYETTNDLAEQLASVLTKLLV